MDSMLKSKKCFICNHEKDDGIEVLGKFLCSDCQKSIINMSPNDEKYDFYRKKMIDIWQSYTKDME